MDIDIKNFIKNLENIKNNPITILKSDISEMIYLILYQMAKYTIIDAGRSRSLIIKKFADKYGFNPSDLDLGYHYWEQTYFPENAGRDFDGEGSTLSDSWTGKKYELNLTMEDEALRLQELGVIKPSTYHSHVTGRDNSQFKPRMLTYVSDLINKGNYDSIEGLSNSIDKMMKSIENFLLTGKVK